MPREVNKYTNIALHLATQVRPYEVRGKQKINRSEPDAQAFEEFSEALKGLKSRLSVWHRDALNSTTKENNVDAFVDATAKLAESLRGLNASIQKGKKEEVNKLLDDIEPKLAFFETQYASFKEDFPELIQDNPVINIFDRRWAQADAYSQGKNLVEWLNDPELKAPQESQPKAESSSVSEEKLEDDIPALNINEEIVKNQREEGQIGKERDLKDIYTPSQESYNGIIGASKEQWKNRRHNSISVEVMVSNALAAAKLRREGAPFSYSRVMKEAEQIRKNPVFSAMHENYDFVEDTLHNPEKIDRAERIWEQESKAGPLKRTPTSYSEVLRSCTWPHVEQSGDLSEEKEALAMAMAANRLQKQQRPFDIQEVVEETQRIQRSMGFQAVVDKADRDTLKSWLYQENLVIAEQKVSRRQKYLQSEMDKTIRQSEQKKDEPQKNSSKQAAPQKPEVQTSIRAFETMKDLSAVNPSERLYRYRMAGLLPPGTLNQKNAGQNVSVAAVVKTLREKQQLDLAELAQRGPALIKLAVQEAKRNPNCGVSGVQLSRELSDSYSYVLKTAAEEERKTPGFQSLQDSLTAMENQRWKSQLSDHNLGVTLRNLESKYNTLTEEKSGFFLSSTNSPEHDRMTQALEALRDKIRLQRGEGVDLNESDQLKLRKMSLREVFREARQSTYEYYRLKTKNGTSSSFLHEAGKTRCKAAREALKSLDELDRALKLQSPAERKFNELQTSLVDNRLNKAWMQENLADVSAKMVQAVGLLTKRLSVEEEGRLVSGQVLDASAQKVMGDPGFKNMMRREGSRVADNLALGARKLAETMAKARETAQAQQSGPRLVNLDAQKTGPRFSM